MSKSVLIVGSPSEELLTAARALNIEPTVLNGGAHPGGPGTPVNREAGDIRSTEDVLRAARACRAQGILAVSELAVVATAQAANELDLPGVSPWAATRTRNKVALRQALAARGLPNPAYRDVTSPGEAEAAAREIGPPVVVKPVDGYACLGVRRVDHVEDVVLAYHHARKHAPSGVVLVEAYLDGEEYSLEGLKVEGEFRVLATARRERAASLCPYATAACMPAQVGSSVHGALVATARAALRAIGMMTGPAHVEIIMTASGPRVVEVGAYAGAARMETALLRLASGIDRLVEGLRVAVGDTPRLEPEGQRGAAVCWLTAHSGFVTGVEGLDEARSLPGVEAIDVRVQAGDLLGHVTDCLTRDRLGHVVATGADGEEALANAKRARDWCRIVTSPAH